MLMMYALSFCRVVIGLIFAYSALNKARNVPAFEQAISNIALLPRRSAAAAAWFFLAGEAAVAALMLFGGPALWPGFGLALILLLVFSIALVSVLVRKIHTSCNCFGPNKNLVAPADIWRNAGFILCALGGCGALAASKDGTASLGLAEWAVIGLAAAVFALVWVQIGDIVRLLQQRS